MLTKEEEKKLQDLEIIVDYLEDYAKDCDEETIQKLDFLELHRTAFQELEDLKWKKKLGEEKKLVILSGLLNLVDKEIKTEDIDGTFNQMIIGNKYVDEKISILELKNLLKEEFEKTKNSLFRENKED